MINESNIIINEILELEFLRPLRPWSSYFPWLTTMLLMNLYYTRDGKPVIKANREEIQKLLNQYQMFPVIDRRKKV